MSESCPKIEDQIVDGAIGLIESVRDTDVRAQIVRRIACSASFAALSFDVVESLIAQGLISVNDAFQSTDYQTPADPTLAIIRGKPGEDLALVKSKADAEYDGDVEDDPIRPGKRKKSDKRKSRVKNPAIRQVRRSFTDARSSLLKLAADEEIHELFTDLPDSDESPDQPPIRQTQVEGTVSPDQPPVRQTQVEGTVSLDQTLVGEQRLPSTEREANALRDAQQPLARTQTVIDRITESTASSVNAYTGPKNAKMSILGAMVASEPIITSAIEWITNQNRENNNRIRDMMDPNTISDHPARVLNTVDNMINGAIVNRAFAIDTLTRLYLSNHETDDCPTPQQWAEDFPQIEVQPHEIVAAGKRIRLLRGDLGPLAYFLAFGAIRINAMNLGDLNKLGSFDTRMKRLKSSTEHEFRTICNNVARRLHITTRPRPGEIAIRRASDAVFEQITEAPENDGSPVGDA